MNGETSGRKPAWARLLRGVMNCVGAADSGRDAWLQPREALVLLARYRAALEEARASPPPDAVLWMAWLSLATAWAKEPDPRRRDRLSGPLHALDRALGQAVLAAELGRAAPPRTFNDA